MLRRPGRPVWCLQLQAVLGQASQCTAPSTSCPCTKQLRLTPATDPVRSPETAVLQPVQITHAQAAASNKHVHQLRLSTHHPQTAMLQTAPDLGMAAGVNNQADVQRACRSAEEAGLEAARPICLAACVAGRSCGHCRAGCAASRLSC